jgi:hypothetical protein
MDMKFGVMTLGTIGLLALSSVALAQTPPARTGFQMDIRTGYSVPMGKLRKDVDLSDAFGGQVPIMLDIGGKVIPELFIGGYLGLALGGAGGRMKEQCPNCSAAGFHIGVEAQYHILPAGKVNPWIGYGIGIESGAVGDGSKSVAWGGFQFARLMGGADFRINRVFGVGPFVDLAMGSYSTENIDTGTVSSKTDIAESAVHSWLTFGVRFVFFP